MKRCTKNPGCILDAGHADDCMTTREAIRVLREHGRKAPVAVANWAAAKFLRFIGHKGAS